MNIRCWYSREQDSGSSLGVRGFQTALAPDAPGEVSDLEAWVDVAVAVRAETGAAAALPVMLVLGALQFRIFSRLVFGFMKPMFSTKGLFCKMFEDLQGLHTSVPAPISNVTGCCIVFRNVGYFFGLVQI